MGTVYTTRNRVVANAYWSMLKNLGADVKLDLIARLSASLVVSADSPISTNWTARLAGKWSDSRDADDIVNDIRVSRSTNREIDL